MVYLAMCCFEEWGRDMTVAHVDPQCYAEGGSFFMSGFTYGLNSLFRSAKYSHDFLHCLIVICLVLATN